MLRFFLWGAGLLLSSAVVYAEQQEVEAVQVASAARVAAVQQAIREYDAMFCVLYDAAGAEADRIVLDHSQAEEMAQLLVPLKAAESFTDEKVYPVVVLHILHVDGKQTSLCLTHISPEEESALPYTLPSAEFGRLQWLLLELTEEPME